MLEVTLGLARSLISQSKFDESRELLNEARGELASRVDDKELDGIAMSLLGEVHLKSGEIAAGQALIEKAAKLLPFLMRRIMMPTVSIAHILIACYTRSSNSRQ